MRLSKDTGLNFSRTLNSDRETLKVFLHPPPPSGKRKFIRLLSLEYQKVITLSIQKPDVKIIFFGASTERDWYRFGRRLL